MIKNKKDAINAISNVQDFLNSLSVTGVKACMAISNAFIALNELAKFVDEMKENKKPEILETDVVEEAEKDVEVKQ